jgi:hypothetical protein
MIRSLDGRPEGKERRSERESERRTRLSAVPTETIYSLRWFAHAKFFFQH